MNYYKIKEISRMTSLTVRSLQYYDDIGLLKPNTRSSTGYRLYSENDLLRLQQITTLKFLGFSLTAIKKGSICVSGRSKITRSISLNHG